MAKLDFQSRLEDSISSVYYRVKYVAYFIDRAQQAYDQDCDADARAALEDAACLLDEADEGWAAEKVRYYKRFV